MCWPMSMEKQEFKAKVCNYQLTLTYDKKSCTFRYYEETYPSILYSVCFHQDHTLSTNHQANKLILQTFGPFKHHKLFDYIQEYSQDQQRLTISSAGYVTLWYFKTKTKTKKAIKIQFDGSKLMSESEIKQQKIIRSQVTDVRAENAYLKQTLFNLQQHFNKQTEEINFLKASILNSKKHYLCNLHADTKMLYREDVLNNGSSNQNALQTLKDSINGIKDNLKLMIAKMNSASSQKQLMFPQQDSAGEDEDAEKYGSKHWVIIDHNNQYLAENYQVEGDILRKIGDYGKYQVLGRDPFPLTGKHYFSVFIQKINWSIFSVGIASQSRRNYQTSYDNADCMTYFGKNGAIWRQGLCIGGGQSIPDGVEIRVVVDFPKETIKWYQDGTEIGSSMITKALLTKRLVPYIQLNYPNNQVTFNSRPKNWHQTLQRVLRQQKKPRVKA